MKQSTLKLLVGAHMSIEGGFARALERGESIGCTAIQIFTKSNRQWKAKNITEQEIDAFKSAYTHSTITCVMAHATYLINIGSPDIEVRSKSIAALLQEVLRCEQLNIPYLVLHPGSYLKSDEQSCIKHIADGLNQVLSVYQGSTKILLENMAGQGTSVGHTFEQLAQIIALCNYKSRIGVCFDTCHAFAAGYTFNTADQYTKLWDSFDSIIGLHYLKAMHINDSKKEAGLHVDRHEEIGKGKISIDGFKLLFNDERFFDIPKILETPKESLADDARNLQVIMELISKKTKILLNIK